jgi:hypothetical protein
VRSMNRYPRPRPLCLLPHAYRASASFRLQRPSGPRSATCQQHQCPLSSRTPTSTLQTKSRNRGTAQLPASSAPFNLHSCPHRGGFLQVAVSEVPTSLE